MDHATILLIEDNPDEAALTLRAFKKNNMGSKILVVHDGVEALDFLFCRNTFADRDPCDLQKINGMEVLRRLRADERTRQLPIVIFSSSNEERDLIEGYKSGANSYVRKPVNFNKFEESIQQLSIYWLQWNETPPN